VTFATFAEFYPYYVGQHSKAATRWIHLVGTLAGAATGATLVARGRPAGVLAFPAVSYSAAWASHFLVERNRPATFGHPLWSLRGDVTMIATMLRGRDAELAALAARHRNTHPTASPLDQVTAA
jgi:hypothetical protein